jgi:hypothetical protein
MPKLKPRTPRPVRHRPKPKTKTAKAAAKRKMAVLADQ